MLVSFFLGVLVVAVADVAAKVLLVGAAVDEALGVVDVAVAGGAPGRRRLGRVAQVDEDEAGAAGAGARLGADGDGVLLLLVDDDVLAPDGLGRVLGQAAEVDELAVGGDLGEGGAVGLGDDGELAAVGARPAPGRGPLAGAGPEVGVALEVVEVDLVALEGVVGVAGDDGSDAVDAGDGALLGEAAPVGGGIHLSALDLAVP
ncbi:hypothetical protein ColKHC_06413 [Colletotrichum higginsianum]|nr:hypothetical protein ColKHC_06413 [Colletotrichum higginsianum]